MKQETTRELRNKLRDAQALTNVKIEQFLAVIKDPEASVEEKRIARIELKEIRDHAQATSIKGVKCVDGKLIKLEDNGNGQSTDQRS